jgi:SAM-dependent methyltransferase
MIERKRHWESVYRGTDPGQLSWFEEEPAVSLRLVETAELGPSAPILDVGGGTSSFVDALLDRGYRHLGVLDVSARAIALSRARLGKRADQVEWYVGDITEFRSPHPWELCHDRAVFHFLTDASDRRAYAEALVDALAPGGQLVIATFGPEGPERCSGLVACRYDAETLRVALGGELELLQQELVEHTTPGGTTQQFLFCRFRLPA